MNDIVIQHRKVYQDVYDNQYYIDTFEKVCDNFKGPGNVWALQDLNEICSFWNKFWYSLPDMPYIRRYPFHSICDLAEGSYLEKSND